MISGPVAFHSIARYCVITGNKSQGKPLTSCLEPKQSEEEAMVSQPSSAMPQ